MRHRIGIGFAIALALAGLATAAFATSADDFKAAYAKAETAQKQAVQLKTAWTATVAALAGAKKAADAGNFDEATALAQHAEALANASIAQAKEQETLWRDAVIK
jgi:hypothetical protein